MSAAAAEPAPAVTAAVEDLVGRFDPDAIDVPGGSARIRLEVVDGDDVDVVVDMPEAWIEPASGEADATAGLIVWKNAQPSASVVARAASSALLTACPAYRSVAR